MIEAVFHGIILGNRAHFAVRRSKCVCVQPRGFAAEVSEGTSRRCHCGDLRYDFNRGGCIGGFLAYLDIPWLETIMFAVGILFLLYIGISLWRSAPSSMEAEAERFSPKKQILFAASVSLLNPHAIIDTIGVIGSNALSYSGEARFAFTLTTIIISWCWFFGLAVAGRVLGKLDTSGKFIGMLNKVSAVVVWAVAIYMAIRLLGKFI